MNERSQIKTLLTQLRTKYDQATNDLDRKKIAFLGNSIKALLNEQTTGATR